MALTETELVRVWAHAMRQGVEWSGIEKTDLRAAVDATDAWIEANKAAFNAALPQPFRSAADLPSKTLVFCFVAMRRAGLLITEED